MTLIPSDADSAYLVSGNLAAADLVEGNDLPTLTIPPISRATLALFAGASNDHNPIHIDLDNAKSAGLDDVFAHGMLSMGYLGRYLTGLVPQESVRNFHVRFTAITPVHGAPTCSARVGAVHEEDGRRVAEIALTMRLDDGTVTLDGGAQVTVPVA